MLLALLFLLASADAAPDPEGTVVLRIESGKTAPIEAQPGSNIICDDLSVVTPEFDEAGKGFQLRALQPGSTLCGVWIGDRQPAGLYRVEVVPEVKPPPVVKPPAGPAKK